MRNTITNYLVDRYMVNSNGVEKRHLNEIKWQTLH
jgi:hypothetical protein